MFLPNQKALPTQFDPRLKPSSVSGRTFRVSIPASNASSFIENQTMIFNIPTNRKNCFLLPDSSYLRYTIKAGAATGQATAAATAAIVSPVQVGYNATSISTANVGANLAAGLFLDHDAYSIINSSTLYSGSNVLEQISNANIVYNYLLDTNFSYSNALSQSGNFGMYVPSVDPTEIRRGQFLSWTGTSTGTATAATVAANVFEANTFCTPLLSGLLGLGSNGQAIPIHKIQDVLRLELLLETQAKAFCQLGSIATLPPYTVINAQLELTYVELGQEGMDLINSMSPPSNPQFIVGTSYGHYTNIIKTGTTGLYNCLVPCKNASLRSLHCIPRRNSEITSSSSYSLSSRVNPNIDYFNFIVSGTSIPQTPIFLTNASSTGGYAEANIEIMKCFGSLIATDKGTLLNNNNFNVAATGNTSTGVFAVSTGAESYKNAFALGIDTELYNPQSGVIVNGLNCLAESTYFQANITTNPADDFTLDFISLYDCVFILDQSGYLSSRK